MNKNHVLLWLAFFCSSNFIFSTELNQEQEAETAGPSNNYTVVPNANASGGNFIKLKNEAPSGTLQYNLTDIIAGTYKLEVHTFNGGTALNLDISVNGATATSISLQPSNWAYQGNAKVSLFDVSLTSGTNTISFTANGSDILLDKFVVTEHYNDYYISAVGDDANDGSIGMPWETLAKASAIAEKDTSGGLLVPGDKLFFRAGDTFEGNFLVKCSGTEASPIEIGSYGIGELPIISGSGNISGGDYYEAIKYINASHILMTDLWIQNDRQNNSRYTYGETNGYGIRVTANKWGGVSSGLIFRGLKITNVYGTTLPTDFDELNVTGLRFEAEQNETNLQISIKDVLIEDCYFSEIGKAGVWAIHKGTDSATDDLVNRNEDFVIRNNTFYQTGGSGVILSKMYNARVENNDFDHSGYSNGTETRLAGRGSGMWVFKCINVLAQYNRSFSVRGSGDSYGMHIDFGNKNIIYQYNYSEDSEGGFCEVLGDNHNVAYRFNISVNDGFRATHGSTIWTSGYVGSDVTPIPSDDVYVYNNTIYLGANQKPDITLFSEDTYIYNNIFKQTGSGQIGEVVDIDIQNGGELIVSNNLFQGNINTAFSNLDAAAVFVNPNFENEGAKNIEGYKLLSNSAAIDAGKNFPEPIFPMAGQGIFQDITLVPQADIFGNTVDISTLLPNIGADNNFNSEIDPTNISVTGVAISSQNGVLIPGNEQTFTATVSPVDAVNKNLIWSSANTSIATVDNTGKVTGIAVGSTSITVETEDGGFTATTAINVSAEFAVTLLNGDFEQGLADWDTWASVVSTTDAYYGSTAIELTGPSSVKQWVAVKPSTTYTLSAFAKVVDPNEDRVVLGVNDQNDNGIANVQIYDTSYTLQKLMFTTSAQTDSIKVFFWRPSSGIAEAYVDEVALKETAYALNADFEKGLHAWDTWGSGTVSTETINPFNGNASLLVTGNGGANQVIKTKPSTTYEMTFTAKVENASKHVTVQTTSSTGIVYFAQKVFDTTFTEYTISFTTDANEEDTKIGFWRPDGTIGGALLDNLNIREVVLGSKSVSKRKTLTETTVKRETNVYPNPASDTVFIDANGFEGNVNIVLYSMLGVQVVNERFSTNEISEYLLSVDELARGHYYLILTDSLGNQTKTSLLLK
tara:strand:+ start:323 stop:3748 length:3426 start_codon:yes stop_codon:yes gene_type:complete